MKSLADANEGDRVTVKSHFGVIRGSVSRIGEQGERSFLDIIYLDENKKPQITRYIFS